MYRSFAAVCALALGASFVSQHAAAQSGSYPVRPVRIVVPAAPGGGTDYTSRTIAQRLTETLGQSVIVDNRPGAAGNIGVEIAAKSNPDGYTLVMPITSFPINPHLYKKMPFDTVKDLAPITLASIAPLHAQTPSGEAFSAFERFAEGADHTRAIRSRRAEKARAGGRRERYPDQQLRVVGDACALRSLRPAMIENKLAHAVRLDVERTGTDQLATAP